MNVTLLEGNLRFEFLRVKVARRWDHSSAYERGVKRLPETSAADFFARFSKRTIPRC